MKGKRSVLLTRGLHPFAMRELGKRFTVRVHRGKIPMPKRELVAGIRDVDGIICFPYDRIDREVMDSAERLRVVSTYSVGFDHIDVEHAKRKKIRVGYTPGVLTDATAELTMSVMLDVMRRVSEGDRTIRRGAWRQIYGARDYVGSGAGGKTLGILGMGRIGEAVAKRAAAFDMKIIYHNRTRRLPRARERSLNARFVSMGELVAKSDVLSLHVPHTGETDGMIDAGVLGRMKKTAFLINTSRGRVVNERHLVRSLERGDIAGAALDVFESEPISKSHRLCRLENVVLVPHIGSSTRETRERMAEIAVRNLKRGIAGRDPVYSVGYNAAG